MTAQPRDPRGRFLPAMTHEDAARIAGAAPHIEPVRPAHGHVARAYQTFPELRPQAEIDAEPYDPRDWVPTPNRAFAVLMFILAALTFGAIADFLGSLL